MNDHGIAWMIAGGQRETPEDRRMRQHRIALAEHARTRPAAWSTVRQRIAAAVARPTMDRRDERAPALDCCPA